MENFPDDKLRENLRDLFTINDNDVISETNLNIKNLSLFKKGITDLTGIQWFYELEVLNIAFNTITSGAVEFRNFNNLKELNAQNCKLTTIDLSQNKVLEKLNLDGNRLTKLDVSKNTKLTNLNIRNQDNYTENGNRITTLDIQNNTELTSLVIGNNEMSAQTIEGIFDTLAKIGNSVYVWVGKNDLDKVTRAMVAKHKGEVSTGIGTSSKTVIGLLVLDEKHFPDKVLRDAVVDSFRRINMNEYGNGPYEAIKEGDAITDAQISEMVTKYSGLNFSKSSQLNNKTVDLTGIEYLFDVLTDFTMNNGTIKNLDLSKCAKLRTLSIVGSNIESGSFDFSANADLSGITLKNLTLPGVQTSLTNIKLGYTGGVALNLDVTGNSLQVLDLSNVKPGGIYLSAGNNELYTVRFPNTAYAISYLDLSSNNLESLNLSNAKGGIDGEFYVESNQLSSITFPTSRSGYQSSLIMNLTNNKLTNATYTSLVNYFKFNSGDNLGFEIYSYAKTGESNEKWNTTNKTNLNNKLKVLDPDSYIILELE